jgi:hypothetical protein
MRSQHDAHNYGTNPTEPISVGAGTFIGIESFKLANDSNQFVFDAHKTATVTGSNGRDYLDGGGITWMGMLEIRHSSVVAAMTFSGSPFGQIKPPAMTRSSDTTRVIASGLTQTTKDTAARPKPRLPLWKATGISSTPVSQSLLEQLFIRSTWLL